MIVIVSELRMDILYKYMSAERILTCLPEVGDGTLRATQPASLNDPFESHVAIGYVEREETEENRELSDILTALNVASPVSVDDVGKARRKYGSLYLRELLSRQLSRRFGIVSFSTEPCHPLMWAHYTVDGSGFVIGYDAEQIRRLGRDEDCLRPVLYESEIVHLPAPEVLTEDNAHRLLSLKSNHWKYEQEWRLILELSETIGSGNRDRHDQPINLVRVPNSAVKSLYFTERTPTVRVDEIRRRVKDPNNRYGDVNLVKLVLSERQYGHEDECSL